MGKTISTVSDRCWPGRIAAPPRSSPLAAAIVVGIVGALTMAMVLPRAAGGWMLAVPALLLILSIGIRAVHAVHTALLALAWMAWMIYAPHPLRGWPLHLLAPLILYGIPVILIAPLRRTVGWPRRGGFGPNVRRMAGATIVVSVTALVLWTHLAAPDLTGHLARMPKLPLYLLPPAAIGFACLNAAMEEILFRGVILEALDSTLGETFWPVGIQAAAFAVLHYRSGFPNGMLGVLMAFVYGLMLGALRRRAGGMLAPWLAHVAADIAIFAILAVILLHH